VHVLVFYPLLNLKMQGEILNFITVLTHEHSEVNKYNKGVNITGGTKKYTV
jgi:hypothetical protein